MEKFLKLLLGTQDVPTYCAYFVFALIGTIVSLYIEARGRNKHSKLTPYRFSWSFWVKDNAFRLIAGFCMIFLLFRFSEALIGAKMSIEVAAVIGLLSDRLVGMFEKIKKTARKAS